MESNNKQSLIERILEQKLQGGRKGRFAKRTTTISANTSGTKEVCGADCGEDACETDCTGCGFCYNDKRLVSSCVPDESRCEAKV